MSSIENKSAEELFIEAFERLKVNKPTVLPSGTPVTQNNVAREAGRNTSALRKERYPRLVLEIQAWVRSQQEQHDATKRSTDNRTRTLKMKLRDHRKQVEKLSSIVAAQDNYIIELLEEIDKLKAGKVVTIDDNSSTRPIR